MGWLLGAVVPFDGRRTYCSNGAGARRGAEELGLAAWEGAAHLAKRRASLNNKKIKNAAEILAGEAEHETKAAADSAKRQRRQAEATQPAARSLAADSLVALNALAAASVLEASGAGEPSVVA